MPPPGLTVRPPAVVLLSGGLDSATTLAWAVEHGFDPHALTLSYGQRHALEIERAREIACRSGVRAHRVVSLEGGAFGGSALTDPTRPVPVSRDEAEIGRSIPATYVPARNTVFLALALSWAEELGAYDLFIGANAVDYSGYPDCRPEYLRAFEALARLATRAGVEGGASFRVRAPLLHMTKAEIVRCATRLGVALARTVSCYDPSPAGLPCRRCDACVLRAKGFHDAGIADPALG